MIKINGEDFPWEEGLTVSLLLKQKHYTHPAIVVTINGVSVPEDDFAVTPIRDGDVIQAIHLVAGG